LIALKLVHPQLAASEAFRSNFWLEVASSARLQSENVVPALEFGEEPRLSSLYIAMPYIPQPDLATLLRENGALRAERSAEIAGQVLEALADAAAIDVRHSNLKPSNVFVQQDGEGNLHVQVADFGYASLTNLSDTLGAVEYGSPERVRGLQLDTRSDIYAVGVMLYEMIAGRLPFAAPTAGEVARLHCLALPPPPSGFRQTHPVLEHVCLKALSKTPEARYQTARDMLADLAPARASVTTPLSRASRTDVRRRAKHPSLAPVEREVSYGSVPKRRGPLAWMVVAGLAGAAWAGYGSLTVPSTLRSVSTGATPNPPPQTALVAPEEKRPASAPLDSPDDQQTMVAVPVNTITPPSAATSRASVELGAAWPHTAASDQFRSALDLRAIIECYQASLDLPGAVLQPSEGRLDLEAGPGGRVVWSKLRARQLPAPTRKCIERATHSARVTEQLDKRLEASVILQFDPRAR